MNFSRNIFHHKEADVEADFFQNLAEDDFQNFTYDDFQNFMDDFKNFADRLPSHLRFFSTLSGTL